MQSAILLLKSAERNRKASAQNGRHDRLIHAQVLDNELIERAARMPIALDLQPHFVASDFPWVIDRLGKDRMKTAFAWKTLISKGILCAGGSDAPIEPVDPLLGIQSAVLRKSSHEQNGPSYNESECLPVYEAIKLYTEGSAGIIYKEKSRGKLRKAMTRILQFSVVIRLPLTPHSFIF